MGMGPSPDGAAVLMCHRLDTRRNRLETSGPAAGASRSGCWRWDRGIFGTPGTLRPAQRDPKGRRGSETGLGVSWGDLTHSPGSASSQLGSRSLGALALSSLRSARHRREQQGLGILTLNYLQICKEHGTSGPFHLRFLPTQPSRVQLRLEAAVLSVELKFGEMRGSHWLSLGPRAEDTETKKSPLLGTPGKWDSI